MYFKLVDFDCLLLPISLETWVIHVLNIIEDEIVHMKTLQFPPQLSIVEAIWHPGTFLSKHLVVHQKDCNLLPLLLVLPHSLIQLLLCDDNWLGHDLVQGLNL